MRKKLLVGLLFTIILTACTPKEEDQSSNVTTSIRGESDFQTIRMTALGGYTPREIIAEGDKPVRLEVETKGTYDCSSNLSFPALDYQKQLPPTGITTIDIPPQSAGSELKGLCGMGMFSFDIKFK